ncbi:hypothetical protein LSH36_782g01015 [Paralvinella palmiformis]|uniref:Uncharacterized protein n=1 Tax=Paralvinella palmiformis TaxID=53620 RepID=A0AAD9MUC0_9ANNE|nr:hypothetical protein LSH36_782g01015 [Paralvinella palmiformis]
MDCNNYIDHTKIVDELPGQ